MDVHLVRPSPYDKGYAKYYRKHMQHPLAALRNDAKRRARNRGRPFSISLDSIKALWPENGACPLCFVKLERHTRHAPSLDEILIGHGYVDGNVSIICRLCNSHKNNYPVEWFDRVAVQMRDAATKLEEEK